MPINPKKHLHRKRKVKIMGVKLQAYYDAAKVKGGVSAQIKLAMITCMSQQKAKDSPDSPENIKIFEEALKKL